jgi:hypothetical protein
VLGCGGAELVTEAVVVRGVGKGPADVEVVMAMVQLKPRRDTSVVVAPISETLIAGQLQSGLIM